jgi:transposase-like protein
MPEDLSHFCCQNHDCADYGRRGLGNLTVCGHYGKDQQRRLLYCRTCKDRFSERKGTLLFGSQLTEAKVQSILEHLRERNGIRATARLVAVNRNTVVRYSRLAGEHAQQIHDEFVAFSPGDPRGPVRREVVVRLQEAGAL